MKKIIKYIDSIYDWSSISGKFIITSGIILIVSSIIMFLSKL